MKELKIEGRGSKDYKHWTVKGEPGAQILIKLKNGYKILKLSSTRGRKDFFTEGIDVLNIIYLSEIPFQLFE